MKSHVGNNAAGAGDPERAITGLLIHCCADGLAMGSAFMSGNTSLSLVLGTAMVLHKAPMAFGLSSYLMSCRWTWARAQKTLLVFSATAPVATIMTFGLLNILPFMSGEKSVALAILFSGGTFLYASTMHILPEVSSKGKMGKNETVAVAAGCLLPVLLSWGHHH
jgi:zinc transporter 9